MGYLSSFKVNDKVGEGMKVSYLLFVDDTLFFARQPKLR